MKAWLVAEQYVHKAEKGLWSVSAVTAKADLSLIGARCPTARRMQAIELQTDHANQRGLTRSHAGGGGPRVWAQRLASDHSNSPRRPSRLAQGSGEVSRGNARRPTPAMENPMSGLPTRDAPPVIRYHTVEVDGVDIFYSEAGPADAPVVLHCTASRRPPTCSGG